MVSRLLIGEDELKTSQFEAAGQGGWSNLNARVLNDVFFFDAGSILCFSIRMPNRFNLGLSGAPKLFNF